MKFILFNVLISLSLMTTGCATNVKMHPAELVRVNLIVENTTPQYLYLNRSVEAETTGGTGIFENTHYFTLFPGQYVKVATGNSGTYYHHVENGLSMKSGPITEKRFGGFKIPTSNDGKWLLWNAPNYTAFFVSTGATKEDFVERVEIPDISKHLRSSEN